MNMPSDHFDMNVAPMRIGAVRLKVRDLATISGFYQRTLGLIPLSESDSGLTLGTGKTPLIHLEGNPAFIPHDPRQAGLFHTAFLMPSRADLARWLAFVIEIRVPLQGASDHIVSEAIYLADPEGNGIEVYADRPPNRWRDAAGEINMATEPLDAQDLLSAAGGTGWSRFPENGIIGHVHLQVGDTTEAERFYRDVLGFDVTSRFFGASFFGSGGYHHQLAGNIWNSRRAGHRPDSSAGLGNVEVVVRDPSVIVNIVSRAKSAGIEVTNWYGGTTLHDPWDTAITLRA